MYIKVLLPHLQTSYPTSLGLIGTKSSCSKIQYPDLVLAALRSDFFFQNHCDANQCTKIMNGHVEFLWLCSFPQERLDLVYCCEWHGDNDLSFARACVRSVWSLMEFELKTGAPPFFSLFMSRRAFSFVFGGDLSLFFFVNDV